jgi:hypothetical protein
MRDKINSICVYKGGGYSGCVWEWNCCFFDKDGQFHNVHASGSMGCTTKEDFDREYAGWTDDDYAFFDVHSQEKMKEFVETFNPNIVLGTASWLRNKMNITIKIPCSDCGGLFECDEIDGYGSEYQGGIVYTFERLVCHNCRNENYCVRCDCKFEDCDEAEDEQYFGHCKDCYKLTLEEENTRLRNQLFKSKLKFGDSGQAMTIKRIAENEDKIQALENPEQIIS